MSWRFSVAPSRAFVRLSLVRLSLACAAAVTVAASMTAPAIAAPVLTQRVEPDLFIVPNATLYTDSCVDHTFSFRAAGPTGADSWTMEARAVGPFGNEQDMDFEFGLGDYASGDGAFIFCGVEPPGAYAATATLTWLDSETGASTVKELSTSFQMAAPASRTTLQAFDRTLRVGQSVKLRVKTDDLGPEGFEPSADSLVKVEMFRYGKWRPIRNANCVTNERGYGKLVLEVGAAGKLRVRAVTTDPQLQPSVSKPVKIRVR